MVKPGSHERRWDLQETHPYVFHLLNHPSVFALPRRLLSESYSFLKLFLNRYDVQGVVSNLI